uniref:RING-type domain-containing protein n=1 Tax=viral metagenome TaxID=1070528 RepID=A0A6C0AXF3_9ZZZZ
MSQQKECNICCEKYNLTLHKEITCEYTDCKFTCCKTCIRTYLMGTTEDPHCMKCKKPWNDKFLVTNLNRAFCDKEYKSHRKKMLVDKEISKLPETMEAAEKQKKIEVEQEKSKVLKEKIHELNVQLQKLKDENHECHNRIQRIRRGDDPNTSQKRKFIMACPNNLCRGYLSTQYKCDLCELFTCPHCLEVIGYNKTDEHTCNPDSVASAEFIKKDTKPCPQCGVRIHKISGCNQMWCTECKIAFDYITLRIDHRGVIHNPHYYQHLAQQNNGNAPRNPQDILCGGLCAPTALYNTIYPRFTALLMNVDERNILIKYLSDIHRTISHITYYELPPTRRRVRELLDPEDLRIDYILGKKDKKQIETLIYKRDVQRKKNNELLHIYELLSVIGIETFNLFLDRKTLAMSNYIDIVNNKILELNNLRIYCNKEFSKISVTYNQKTTWINNFWEIESKKYNISDVK